MVDSPSWLPLASAGVAAYAAVTSSVLAYLSYRAGRGRVLVRPRLRTAVRSSQGGPCLLLDVAVSNRGRLPLQVLELRIVPPVDPRPIKLKLRPRELAHPLLDWRYIVVTQGNIANGGDQARFPATVQPGHTQTWQLALHEVLRASSLRRPFKPVVWPGAERMQFGFWEPLILFESSCFVAVKLGDGSVPRLVRVPGLRPKHLGPLISRQ